MRIYTGTADLPLVGSDHTAFVISCGLCAGSDTLTLRRQGREDWSLFYCERGCVHFKDTLLLPGQVWIFPPKAPQWYFVRREEDTVYRYLHFTGHDLFALVHRLNLPLQTPLPGGFCGDLLEEIRVLSRQDDPASCLQCEGLTLRILAGLSPSGLPSDRRMARVTDAMEHDLCAPYDAARYAALLGVGSSQFNHLFSQAMGMPLKRYFLSLRMESACRMLEQTSLSVGQIAALVGYPDPLCFGQIFRRFKGCSPSAYRKTYAELQ